MDDDGIRLGRKRVVLVVKKQKAEKKKTESEFGIINFV